MTKSIVQEDEQCIICGSIQGLQRHHIFFGRPNRQHSEEDGLWCWVCYYHHNASMMSVHQNHAMDLKLKKYAQSIYEQKHTREEFMERYGKNYL